VQSQAPIHPFAAIDTASQPRRQHHTTKKGGPEGPPKFKHLFGESG
jgi:hypothetical protein